MSTATKATVSKPLTDLLPSSDQIDSSDDEFWQSLEVNAERIREEAAEPEQVESYLASFRRDMLEAFCAWLDVDAEIETQELRTPLAQHVAENCEDAVCLAFLFLNEFAKGKRDNAIQSLSKHLLPAEQFDLVNSSSVKDASKRFCYVLLAYAEDPSLLRSLMLFDNAERAGYERHQLVADVEEDCDNGEAEEVEETAQNGYDLDQLDEDTVGDILNASSFGDGKASRCFDLFRDEERDETLVFVLRELRESRIREVENVVFAQEAETIVLRLSDGGKSVETHSKSRTDTEIAQAIAASQLDEERIQYVETRDLTKRSDLERLIKYLRKEKDDDLRLYELFLENAPVEGAPVLMLRGEKEEGISDTLRSLEKKDVSLLQDLGDVRYIGVSFATQVGGKEKYYVFKFSPQQVDDDTFYLRYSASSTPTTVRASFEDHMKDKYNVKVIPGSR
jgi:hypothetical protein